MTLLKFKCVKCNKEFLKDPRLAKPFMLCDECEREKFDLPEGFEALFGNLKKW